MLKKMVTALLMSAAVSGAVVFSTGCSEEIEGNEQTHPTYIKAKQAREAAKYQDAADLLNDLLSKAPNSAFLHRELAQLYGDNLYNYPRAIYHYERHLELAKTLSDTDREDIQTYIESCKKKSAQEMIKNNPQLVPKPEIVPEEPAVDPVVLEEKEQEVLALKEQNAAVRDQYLKLYTEYSEARKQLLEYKENRSNSEPAAPAAASRTSTNGSENATAAAETSADGYQIYTVQAGDYPGTIASKHGVSLKKLMEVNGLTEQSAKRIRIGQKLKIPKK